MFSLPLTRFPFPPLPLLPRARPNLGRQLRHAWAGAGHAACHRPRGEGEQRGGPRGDEGEALRGEATHLHAAIGVRRDGKEGTKAGTSTKGGRKSEALEKGGRGIAWRQKQLLTSRVSGGGGGSEQSQSSKRIVPLMIPRKGDDQDPG